VPRLLQQIEVDIDWTDETDWDAEGVCACQRFEWYEDFRCSCSHRITVHIAKAGPRSMTEGRGWHRLVLVCDSPGCECADFHP